MQDGVNLISLLRSVMVMVIHFPIGYDDIKDWYSHVEKFIGVCGNKDGIESMPDGEFLTAYELNAVEQHLQEVIREKFNRHYVSGQMGTYHGATTKFILQQNRPMP